MVKNIVMLFFFNNFNNSKMPPKRVVIEKNTADAKRKRPERAAETPE